MLLITKTLGSALASTVALLALNIPLPAASAQTLSTLVSFNGSNGSSPAAKLVEGSDGNFYGTTSQVSTVFRITPNGTLNTLINFNFTNGSQPTAELVKGSDGNFYGTTQLGGLFANGTIFRLTPSGTFTTLVNFNNTNGGFPAGGLVEGNDGNFYGTTQGGGSSNGGTVFKLTPSGALTTLVSFIYDPATGTSPNGDNPSSTLVLGRDGNFYGTTTSGGGPISNACPSGCGTVFRMTPSGKLTTLINFNGTNGTSPSGLVQGTDGNFYGTTFAGGSSKNCGTIRFTRIPVGCGTIFKLTPRGKLSRLVNFDYSTKGGKPAAALIQASDGNFYGTTSQGGSANVGTVFQMTSMGTLTTLTNFNNTLDGSNPYAGVVQGSDGNLYGTTSYGGTSNQGTVFKLTLP